jgi:hypothetical protein
MEKQDQLVGRLASFPGPQSQPQTAVTAPPMINNTLSATMLTTQDMHQDPNPSAYYQGSNGYGGIKMPGFAALPPNM